MTRSELDQLIRRCREHKCVDGERLAKYALILWAHGRDEEARKQRGLARESFYKHMNIWPK